MGEESSQLFIYILVFTYIFPEEGGGSFLWDTNTYLITERRFSQDYSLPRHKRVNIKFHT